MVFIQLVISTIILFILYKLFSFMIKAFKERKELDKLFMKS